MKKMTLLALLALCTFGLWAENADPFPTNLVNQTKFDFASMAFNWGEITSAAYTNETEGIHNTNNDVVLYIHPDDDLPVYVYAWDGNDNRFLGEFPGTELTEFKAVANKNDLNLKKGYWKLQIPNKTNFSFIVSHGSSETQSIETILNGAGVYFIDYNGKKDAHLNQTDAYNQNQQYHNTTSTTVHVRVIDSDIVPYVYAFWNPGEYYTPQNANWPGNRMEEEWLGGEKWYKSPIWNADWSNGAIIFSDNGNNQTTDITNVEAGDVYYYYYPNGYGDKYKSMGFLNKPTSQTFYKEYDFTPQSISTDDMSAELESPTKINFAELTSEGFTLSISSPRGLNMQDMIVNGRLRLYLNTTITFAQKDGHNINMLAFGGWHGNGNEGSLDRYVLDTDQLNQQGHFNTPAVEPIDHMGNDYTLVGGTDPSQAYQHVAAVDAPVISYTYTDPNYGINRQFIEFDSIRVRDERISSSIVDLYGVYRGFSWEITSPMVVVRYSGYASVPGIGENYTGEGVIYCRSLEPSRTYQFPKPTEEQIAKGRIGSNADDEHFSNWDWLAIRLSPEMKEVWDNMWGGDHNPEKYIGLVIKPGTIKGHYCDFIDNLSRLATAYLNPTIVAQQLPEIDDSRVVETPLNTYYLFNFVKQDDVFFNPPKRNEVCNLNYVLPSGDDYVVYGAKTEFEDNEGNVFELKSKVRIYGYYDNNTNNKSDEMEAFFQKLYTKSTYEMCRDNQTAIVRDALVQMINHHGEHYYVWEPHLKENPNNNTNSEYLMAPRNAESEYFYSPIDDTQSPGATTPGYLLPILDYGGGGDVFEVDGTIAKYYGVYPQHRLAINPNLAARNPKNIEDPYVTGVDEVMANNDAFKIVATVEYYNATGMRSNTPFNGFNVVVTRYTDGSMSAKKIMKSN